MPQSMSRHADELDHLFKEINIVAGITLAVTGVVLFVALYRSSPHRPVKFVSGHVGLEFAWTLIPAIILVALAVYQSGTWKTNKIDFPKGEQPIARVVARQFDWEFFYAGPDGILNTVDDLRSVNELVVPSSEHVLLELHSLDVIHSFSVPKLRIKQDIVPGTVHRIWFTPTQVGKLEIICAELCGWGHYNMQAKMSIVSPAEFDRWLNGLANNNLGDGNLD